ncbi:hypothetical protein SNE40_003721 [Patella caerulea]|uniref:C3H1-type domain-containing protein n=1 Tax=Patella caerulea TaxID=87958 RepID=A0AAN8KER4_PATCE
MGRQYYCEFCEKSFADNPSSRKNHLNGTQHKNNRKNHYNSFKDPDERLQEERRKRPCKNFPRGMCDFGDNCRYSHLTEADFAQLEQQVLQRRHHNTGPPPSLEDWLSKRDKRIQSESPSIKPDLTLPVYTMPSNLMHIPNLPPSVLPPPPDIFNNLKYEEWG